VVLRQTYHAEGVIGDTGWSETHYEFVPVLSGDSVLGKLWDNPYDAIYDEEGDAQVTITSNPPHSGPWPDPHSGPWIHPHPLCEGCNKQFADWQAMADEVRVLRGKLATKAELIAKLNEAAKIGQMDPENAHGLADDALLKFINDPEIAAAYDGGYPHWCA
jgi:hypothetical protein